jgi:hypothetical protein
MQMGDTGQEALAMETKILEPIPKPLSTAIGCKDRGAALSAKKVLDVPQHASEPLSPPALTTAFSLDLVTKQALGWVLGLGCLCMFLLPGCATPPPRLSSVYLDVVATPEWLADHKIVASWDGQQVELPAHITFQIIPSVITFGVFSDQQGTRVEFGAKQFQITSEPLSNFKFRGRYPRQENEKHKAIWRSGIAYWALCPADPTGQNARWKWTVPTPDELKSRIAGGKVKVIRLVNP